LQSDPLLLFYFTKYPDHAKRFLLSRISMRIHVALGVKVKTASVRLSPISDRWDSHGTSVMEIMQSLKVDGKGQCDHSALAKYYEKLSSDTIYDAE